VKNEITLLPASSSNELQNLQLKQVINSYIRYYATGAGHTARAKRLDLRTFIDFLMQHHGVKSEEALKVSHWDFAAVQSYVDHLLRKREAVATVCRRLATVKHMGRTFAERVPGFVNPAREVRPPRTPISKPKAITTEELKEVRERVSERVKEKRSFIRIRNATIFNLLLDTGLRADEIRLLRLGQIDEDLSWIRDVRTKGRKFRNVYITSAMREELAIYLKDREATLKKFYAKLSRSENLNLPLFISTYNAVPGKIESFMIGPKTLWRAINELSCSTNLHPHLLRHSYAIDLLNESNDVRLVSQALGHSDVRITMRYTERRDEEIAEALEKSRKRSRRSNS